MGCVCRCTADGAVCGEDTQVASKVCRVRVGSPNHRRCEQGQLAGMPAERTGGMWSEILSDSPLRAMMSGDELDDDER